MPKKHIIIALSVIVVGAIVWQVLSNMQQDNSQPTQEQGESVAIVNGEHVSRNEFDAQYAQAEQSYLQQGQDTTNAEFAAQLESQVLDQMIADVLLRQEADKSGVSVEDATIDAEIAGIVENVGGREAFDQELASAGLSEEALRENIADYLRIQAYIDSQISEDEIAVTDEEARAFYDEQSTQQELPPFEELEGVVRDELVQQKRSELINTLISSLRADADVQILL